MIERKTLLLKKGEVVLVMGPSRIKTLKGSFEVFGKLLKPNEIILVNKHKALPVEGFSEGKLIIEFGRNGGIEFRRNIGTSVWRRELSKLSLKEDMIVIGEDDSGKTGLTTFLVNVLLAKGIRVGVIDADPGQGELCEPTMIAAGEATEQVATLSEIKPRFRFFVGKTSPIGLEERVEEGVKELYDKLKKSGCESIIINLHGWIGDKRAFEHIMRIQRLTGVRNSIIIKGERPLLIEKAKLDPTVKRHYVTKPNTYKRAAKSRREIRERKFKRYFMDEKFRRIYVKHEEVLIRGSKIFSGQVLNRGLISGILSACRIPLSAQEIVYGEITDRKYNILKVNKKLSTSLTLKPMRVLDTEVNIYFAGKQLGLVCGIKNQSGWVLGKILAIDLRFKKWIFLVPKKLKRVTEITIGRLVLDKNNQERETLPSDFFSS